MYPLLAVSFRFCDHRNFISDFISLHNVSGYTYVYTGRMKNRHGHGVVLDVDR